MDKKGKEDPFKIFCYMCNAEFLFRECILFSYEENHLHICPYCHYNLKQSYFIKEDAEKNLWKLQLENAYKQIVILRTKLKTLDAMAPILKMEILAKNIQNANVSLILQVLAMEMKKSLLDIWHPLNDIIIQNENDEKKFICRCKMCEEKEKSLLPNVETQFNININVKQ